MRPTETLFYPNLYRMHLQAKGVIVASNAARNAVLQTWTLGLLRSPPTLERLRSRFIGACRR